MPTTFYSTASNSTWVDWQQDTAWGEWQGEGTSTSLSTASTAQTWIKWAATTDATTCADSTETIIWQGWVDTASSVTISTGSYVDHRTPEQIAADEARFAVERAEIKRRADAAAAERLVAIGRARALLHSMLTVKQREQLQKDRFFEVIARGSQRRYRIREGTHGNVRLLDEQDREVTRYCAQPSGVPTEDSMLAQALMLEHDEAAFLKVANATRLTA